MKWIKIIALCSVLSVVLGCKEEIQKPEKQIVQEKPVEKFEFGYSLNDFVVKKDTIKRGDTFGVILQQNHIGYPKIFQIAEEAKDTFDIRRLQLGKPYSLIFPKENLKDSIVKPSAFVYQQNLVDYVVIDFEDTIQTSLNQKPVKFIDRIASGVIENSISETIDNLGLSQKLTNKLADDIYAWTIDFRRLQPGDRFKIMYTDKYIDDSTYAGIHNVKAAYFEHNGDSLYAFQFETDKEKGIVDYFSEKAKNLRRAFLKMPVKFGRLSSRYNLKRRIAFYGNRIRPHKGTDFAAPVGTPILATANGTVIESTRRGGNGKYVKIRHNATYTTQYLHMSRQAVKKGEYVKQGDVIGYVGMTGNTSGPHVCYRFWKNGRQVDPFKQKLPEAEPISDSLKQKFIEYIKPIKSELDNIRFIETQELNNELQITQGKNLDL